MRNWKKVTALLMTSVMLLSHSGMTLSAEDGVSVSTELVGAFAEAPAEPQTAEQAPAEETNPPEETAASQESGAEAQPVEAVLEPAATEIAAPQNDQEPETLQADETGQSAPGQGETVPETELAAPRETEFASGTDLATERETSAEEVEEEVTEEIATEETSELAAAMDVVFDPALFEIERKGEEKTLSFPYSGGKIQMSGFLIFDDDNSKRIKFQTIQDLCDDLNAAFADSSRTFQNFSLSNVSWSITADKVRNSFGSNATIWVDRSAGAAEPLQFTNAHGDGTQTVTRSGGKYGLKLSQHMHMMRNGVVICKDCSESGKKIRYTMGNHSQRGYGEQMLFRWGENGDYGYDKGLMLKIEGEPVYNNAFRNQSLRDGNYVWNYGTLGINVDDGPMTFTVYGNISFKMWVDEATGLLQLENLTPDKGVAEILTNTIYVDQDGYMRSSQDRLYEEINPYYISGEGPGWQGIFTIGVTIKEDERPQILSADVTQTTVNGDGTVTVKVSGTLSRELSLETDRYKNDHELMITFGDQKGRILSQEGTKFEAEVTGPVTGTVLLSLRSKHNSTSGKNWLYSDFPENGVLETNPTDLTTVEPSDANTYGSAASYLAIPMVQVPVEKVWKDNAAKKVDHSKDTVTVTLFADGTSTGKTLELKQDNDWQGVFEGVPKFVSWTKDGGAANITYSVEETEVNGYQTKNGTKTVSKKQDLGEISDKTSFSDKVIMLSKGMDLVLSADGSVVSAALLNPDDDNQRWSTVSRTITINGTEISAMLVKHDASGKYLILTSSGPGLIEESQIDAYPGAIAGYVMNEKTGAYIIRTVASIRFSPYFGVTTKPKDEREAYLAPSKDLTTDGFANNTFGFRALIWDGQKLQTGDSNRNTFSINGSYLLMSWSNTNNVEIHNIGDGDGIVYSVENTPKACEITVTKKFKDKTSGDPYTVTSGSIYVALFSDDQRSIRAAEPVEITFSGADSGSAVFSDLPFGTYYVGETDAKGLLLSGGELQEHVSYEADYDNSASATVDRDTLTGELYLTNYVTEETEEEVEGSLTVTKHLIDDATDEPYELTSGSFYVALFKDEACTQMAVRPQKISFSGASSSQVVFKNLQPGTYYLSETDSTGTVISEDAGDTLSDGSNYYPQYENVKVEITKEAPEAAISFTNRIEEFDDTQGSLTTGKIKVVKSALYADDHEAYQVQDGSFYVALFADRKRTTRVSAVKKLSFQGSKSEYVIFTDIAEGTYYVGETDKNGNVITGGTLSKDITFKTDYVDGSSAALSLDAPSATVRINNLFTEKKVKETQKESETQAGSAVKTGDTTPIAWVLLVLVSSGLLAGAMLVVRRRRYL